eukprot:scaffold666802_cov55-Prasinocladus_malaysianus.AAC.1
MLNSRPNQAQLGLARHLVKHQHIRESNADIGIDSEEKVWHRAAMIYVAHTAAYEMDRYGLPRWVLTVECIAKAALLALLGGQRLDGLEVEVVVQVQVVEVLAVDEQVEHVVALAAHLQARLHPVQLGRLEELGGPQAAEK